MCGGNNPTGEYALIGNKVKRTLLLPFQPGYLYTRFGYDEYRHMVIDSLFGQGWLKASLSVETHPMVEVFLNRYQQNSAGALYNVQLINLSGYNGVSFHEPLPLRDIRIQINLKQGETPKELVLLPGGKNLPFELSGQTLKFSVPSLDTYRMVVIK